MKDYIKIIPGEGALLFKVTAPEGIASVFKKEDGSKTIRITYRKRQNQEKTPNYRIPEESINKSIEESKYGESITNIFEAATEIALRGQKEKNTYFYLKKLDKAYHILKIESPKMTADVYTNIEDKHKTIRFSLKNGKTFNTSPDTLDYPAEMKLGHALTSIVQSSHIPFIKAPKSPKNEDTNISFDESVNALPE
jgi:hypothetical protein